MPKQPKPRQWTRWAWIDRDAHLWCYLYDRRKECAESGVIGYGKPVKVIVTEVKGKAVKRGK